MGIVCANIVLITGKVRYAIYLHMAFNLFGAIISGYIPSGRYTILTEIIFVISAAIIVILKAKTEFIIKDDYSRDLGNSYYIDLKKIILKQIRYYCVLLVYLQ